MNPRKEIKISKKDAQTILLIIIAPFLLTFIIEHFGDFRYKGYGNNAIDYKVTDAFFTTPFGNEFHTIENDGYKQHDGGVFKIKGDYFDKLPFYLKGVVEDFIYPLILVIVLFITFYVRKKFKIRFL